MPQKKSSHGGCKRQSHKILKNCRRAVVNCHISHCFLDIVYCFNVFYVIWRQVETFQDILSLSTIFHEISQIQQIYKTLYLKYLHWIRYISLTFSS